MAESEEELKSLLMRVKEEGEKADLKTLRSWHLVHCFMANRWRKVETATNLFFLASKITAGSDYSHEIKRHLLIGRKTLSRHHIADKGPCAQGLL